MIYQAYQKWKRENGGETTSLPKLNLTSDQLFFLNFGQIWCEVNSPEAMLSKIRSGQHSPNRYRYIYGIPIYSLQSSISSIFFSRVIGTLSNSEEFNTAFNCSKDKKMNSPNKCKVW